jgi:5-(carboxyamino)imidazole ribonucleotide synthase
VSSAHAVRPANGLRIGVLGGGQLGRMLGLAGIPLGFRFLFLDPAADACAAATGELLQAAFDDEGAALLLARQVDLATFDFENVPESSARAVESVCPLHPGSQALGVSQDRLIEKDLLRSLGAAVPAYHGVAGRTELLDALDSVGYPAVLKTRRFGYDGKGQAVLRDAEDLERAWQQLGDAPLILEAFVPFEAECSLVGVRGRQGTTRGTTRFWPLTRNVHAQGILTLSLPGVFDDALQREAEHITRQLMDRLDYTGVLTIEFFLHQGRLLVNEFAPRVHNSGHWTIEGSETSQFQNHLRAVLGLPLGDTRMVGLACMLNWIGEMPDASAVLGEPGGHWHDYGKEPRAGRKVGHATLRADSAADLADAVQRVGALLGRDAQVAPVLAALA